MDSQQTYLLNGLLVRQFAVGRIVRFRQAHRGRQAETFELFTAEEHEYLVQLYPPHYSAEQLNAAAAAVNTLDGHRFSVVPFIASKQGAFAAEGLQQGHLLLSLAPTGSALSSQQYTEHDISQLGLRLGWMHRLMREQLAEPAVQATLADRFYDLHFAPSPEGPRVKPTEDGPLERIHALLNLPVARGWAHGDIQTAGLLHDGDQQLRAVMDWGLLHFGCPLEDVVDAFWWVALDHNGRLDVTRGRALLEAYDSLVPIRRVAWTPVVAWWCAQRVVDFAAKRRELPDGFYQSILPAPERLATALASCL